MTESDKRGDSPWAKGLKIVLSATGAIVVLVGAYHGYLFHIDYRIEKRLHDAEFLKEISYTLRPSVVFDQKNTILADMGAMQYIDEITVETEGREPTKIIVAPKVFLGIAPLLECLDGEFGITKSRGKKFVWVYELESSGSIRPVSSGRITNHRFRIEVLR